MIFRANFLDTFVLLFNAKKNIFLKRKIDAELAAKATTHYIQPFEWQKLWQKNEHFNDYNKLVIFFVVQHFWWRSLVFFFKWISHSWASSRFKCICNIYVYVIFELLKCFVFDVHELKYLIEKFDRIFSVDTV